LEDYGLLAVGPASLGVDPPPSQIREKNPLSCTFLRMPIPRPTIRPGLNRPFIYIFSAPFRRGSACGIYIGLIPPFFFREMPPTSSPFPPANPPFFPLVFSGTAVLCAGGYPSFPLTGPSLPQPSLAWTSSRYMMIFFSGKFSGIFGCP